MAVLCPAPDPDRGLVYGLTATVDCNVQGLAETAYGALARPGSMVSAALFGLLTLYVAFIGYRMLLGRTPLRIGDLTISALKIGLVVLLATNWGVYQTVVYNTLARGPSEVAGALLGVLQPEGSAFRGDPFQGLQVAFDQLQLSAGSFAGRAGGSSATMQGGPGFAAFALNASAYMTLLTTLGTVLASRIAIGLVLGLAPLFAAFLLFEATRGLVEGWLRAAVAFAVAPLIATLALTVELLMLEPSLITLAQMRNAARFDMGPPTAVFVLALIFAGVIVAALIASLAIAWGVRLPRLSPEPVAAGEARTTTPAGQQVQPFAAVQEAQPRAAQVAAAAAAMTRRDAQQLVAAQGEGSVERRLTVIADRGPDAEALAYRPLGHSFRRTAGPRRSAAGGRRDR